MKSILEKLTIEEIKELSKKINQEQGRLFGNPLSLRKQEQLMANIFDSKSWDQLCLSKRKTMKKFDPKSEYQKTIISVEVLSEGFYNAPHSLEQIGYDITYGDCIGRISTVERESLNKQEIYKALLETGNDGSFFQIISTDQISLIDDLFSEVNRRLDEQVDLIYSFYEESEESIMRMFKEI